MSSIYLNILFIYSRKVMTEQTIGENLAKLLKLHGDLSLSDLARETQIPQPTLHHIIEGKTKKPRRQALEALANFFSVSIHQLTGEVPLLHTIPDTIKDTLKISTVPLIDWDLAKSWNRDTNDLSKFDEVILDKQVDKNAFALQLQDSSMEPLFQEKSILIFNPTKKANERDFVLVYLAGSDTVKFNRLFIDGHNFYLRQEKKDGNAESIELLKISPKDRIIATLIEARTQF